MRSDVWGFSREPTTAVVLVEMAVAAADDTPTVVVFTAIVYRPCEGELGAADEEDKNQGQTHFSWVPTRSPIVLTR